MDEMLSHLSTRLRNLIKINANSPIQRSKEWFALRTGCITASNASSLLVKSEENCREYIKHFPKILEKYPRFLNDKDYCNPYQDRNDYILQKCGKGKPFVGNVATEWGCRYEDIVCKFYERVKGVKVHEFGLMPHKNLSWIKASPDGISDKDVMLEIKVPYRRKLDGIIPFYYWIQVQVQLEVCDLDECDYIEVKVNQVSQHQFEEETQKPKGFFYEEGGKVIHFFDEDHYEYIDNKDVRFFIIDEYEIMNIKREKEWFERVKPTLEESWMEILEHKRTDCKNLKGTLYIDDDCGEDALSIKKRKPDYLKKKCNILTDEEDDF